METICLEIGRPVSVITKMELLLTLGYYDRAEDVFVRLREQLFLENPMLNMICQYYLTYHVIPNIVLGNISLSKHWLCSLSLGTYLEILLLDV